MKRTYLYLEDGTKLSGVSFGWYGESAGEVVFSTGMTGYTESLTDPSFFGQILTFTYPLIGNYGVPKPEEIGPHLYGNMESEHVWVRGVVVGEHCTVPSHYQSVQSLSEWLEFSRVPGIAGIDTRALTFKLREYGVLRGMITPSERGEIPIESAAVFEVSLNKTIMYSQKKDKGRVALIDCGVKHGILRALIREGYEVVRIPYDADPLDIENIDGVVCSNGPGDPKDWRIPVETIKKVIGHNVPFLGICLGHQLLSLAIGADTYKLLFGHRGFNQPCQDLFTKKAYMTSQNHGYAVKRESIPSEYEEWFMNLNDNTNEGMRHKTKNIRSVQFHPEGDPGPFDTDFIFKDFMGRGEKK